MNKPFKIEYKILSPKSGVDVMQCVSIVNNLDVLENYLMWAKRFTKNTQAVYKSYIVYFLNNFAPDNLWNLTREHIEVFINHQLKRELKNKSINLCLAAINSFCEYLQTTYGLENPMRYIKRLKNEAPEVRLLSPAEYEQVIKSNTGLDKDVVVLLAHTGLRASEFLNLKATDFEGDFLQVRQGKGRKNRFVPINETSKIILKRYLNNQSNSINFSKSNYRKWLWRLCRRCARKANIEPFSPHTLRHYFAVSLHRSGVPIEDISTILGHSNISTTEIYLHLNERKLIGVTDVLD